MLPRVIFILFTIAFIAYTWFHSSKADSKTSDETILITEEKTLYIPPLLKRALLRYNLIAGKGYKRIDN